MEGNRILSSVIGLGLLLAIGGCGQPRQALHAQAPQLNLDSQWQQDIRKSVVLVSATLLEHSSDPDDTDTGRDAERRSDEDIGSRRDSPGTGFVVGWKAPELFIVTAKHVVERLDQGLQAKTASIELLPCTGSLQARVHETHRDMDAAVLAVTLPGPCIDRMNQGDVPSMPLSPLVSSTEARYRTRLKILGRGPGHTREWIRDIPVRKWGDEHREIILDTGKVEEMTSGAPVFSPDGGIVGMVIESSRETVTVLSYRAIRDWLKLSDIPSNMAGDFTELVMKTDPPDARLWVDGTLKPTTKKHHLAPGYINLTLERAGHIGVARQVELREGCWVLGATLPSHWDQRFSRVRWSIWGGAAAFAVLSVGFYGLAYQQRGSFFEMPSRGRLQGTQIFNYIGLGAALLATAGGGSALAGEIWLEPGAKPAIKEPIACSE